jgi:hypothetical protein
MGKESAGDGLMEAAGLRKDRAPLEELLQIKEQMTGSFDKLMTEAHRAIVSAQQTQDASEKMFQQLQKYCSEKVPEQMVKALDAVARDGFQKSLIPLDDSFVRAARDIDYCRDRLTRLSWNWRMLVGPVAAGVAAVLVLVGLMYGMFHREFADMKRYAEWGRRVEAKVLSCEAKDRKALFGWFGGRP